MVEQAGLRLVTTSQISFSVQGRNTRGWYLISILWRWGLPAGLGPACHSGFPVLDWAPQLIVIMVTNGI